MPASLPAEPVVVCATAPIRRGWAVLSGNGGADLLRIRLAGGAAHGASGMARFWGGAGGALPRPVARRVRSRDRHDRPSFDGVHNEVMLETPYAYQLRRPPRRSAEIVRAVMRHHFATAPADCPATTTLARCPPGTCGTQVGLFPCRDRASFCSAVRRSNVPSRPPALADQGSGRPRCRLPARGAAQRRGPWTGAGCAMTVLAAAASTSAPIPPASVL